MAITVDKYPPKMELAGNGLIFKLSTDNMYSSAGTACIATLTRVGAIAVDETIVIEWGEKTVTFTAKASPDTSGLQITAGGSATLHQQEISANFDIANDFQVGLLGASIIFSAREKGADYQLTITPNTSAYNELYSVTGTDAVIRDNFSVIVQTMQGSTILGTDRIVPDLDGILYVNVADYMIPLISVDFKFPEDTTDWIHKRNDARQIYQIKFAEAFGTTLAVQKTTISNELFAMPGKLAEDKLRMYYQFNESFWTRMSNSKNFLSWGAWKKLTTAAIPEKLYFPVWFNVTTSVYVNLKLYFTDGTDATLNNYKGNTTLDQYDIVEIQAGYGGLDLAGYMATHQPTKTVSAYELWLTHDSLIVSEIRRYDIDFKNKPWQKIFLFKNTLGVWEAFRSTGKTTRKQNTTRFIAELSQPESGFDSKLRSEYQFNSDSEKVYECNSGYFHDIDNLRWAVAEFIPSGEVYEVNGSELIPIMIDSNSVTVYKDGETRFYFSFDYRAIGNGNIITSDSNPFTPGEYNDDYSNDYTI